jgi:predicted DNA-binding transcriptional regulator AlpA
MSDTDRLLPAAQVLTRYSVTAMTVWRWLRSKTLNFPKPITINRRRYWRLQDLVSWERERATAPTPA